LIPAARRQHHAIMRRPVLLLPLFAALLGAPPSGWAQPRPEQTRADPRQVELDTLLTTLQRASTEQEAALLETRIRQLWQQAGSPAARLLMNRGVRDLDNNADSDALDDFDAVLALEPNLPDAFGNRALARSALGDYTGAVADIEAALQREPRDFAALESLSHIAEDRGDFTGALAAWRRVLALSPMTPGGAERLRLLTRKALGENT
jgi:tetratricopeptide (TPR) repeat protein